MQGITQIQAETIAQLNGSFLLFCQTFFPFLTGKEFFMPQPKNRECHVITICRALMRVFDMKVPSQRLIINVPPGHFKCLTPDTLITTESGTKPLSHLLLNERVLSWDDVSDTWNWQRVIAMASSLQPVIEIQTLSGRRVKCSPEHRWLVKTDGFPRYKPVRLFNKNEFLWVGLPNPTLEEKRRFYLILLEILQQQGHYERGELFFTGEVPHLELLQVNLSANGLFAKLVDGKLILHHESFKDFLIDVCALELQEEIEKFSASLFASLSHGLPHQKPSLLRRRGGFWDKLTGITDKNELAEMIDIQVEHTQTFLANGITSHNSTLLSFWTAWAFSQYPDCRFIYTSYSHRLAANHTGNIKRLMCLPQYQDLYDVPLDPESRAKDQFKTLAGGTVGAFGTGGSITGMDAGLPNLDRFSGALIIDDAHKVDEANSDLIRQNVLDNYQQTIQQRPRGKNVPIVYIGQRVHQEDLAGWLLAGNDGQEWEHIIIPALDEHDEPIYPEEWSLDRLRTMKEFSRYVYASQYQQDPVDPSNTLYRPEWFPVLDIEPKMLYTFITADTAETEKTFNDATVFSFWGVYKIQQNGITTDLLGLHWLDCMEIRVTPDILEEHFMEFWNQCMYHPVKPNKAYIEKKSTGTTLSAVLKAKVRGIQIVPVDRTAKSKSKSDRYIEMQPYISQRLISFTEDARHYKKCLEHMTKITADQSHRWDDICDTVYDAILNTFILKPKHDTEWQPVFRTGKEKTLLC